jgi:formate--tetrahydrofolate ligase
VGLGGPGNGDPRQGGFDIVMVSEMTAILCLASELRDLKERIGRIGIGHTPEGQPFTASQLQAQGAMAALRYEATKPKRMQSLETTPAILHGGPFSNIVHGCNSVVATRAALWPGDCVVTEAGFGRRRVVWRRSSSTYCRGSGLRPAGGGCRCAATS